MDMDAQIYPEDKKKPDLQVIEGGLSLPRVQFGGKDGGDGSWLLTKVQVHQWFLCRPRNTNQIGLLQYQLVGFDPSKVAAYLFAAGEHMWVSVSRFCSTHELIVVFPNEQDKRDRSDLPGRLDDPTDTT